MNTFQEQLTSLVDRLHGVLHCEGNGTLTAVMSVNSLLEQIINLRLGSLDKVSGMAPDKGILRFTEFQEESFRTLDIKSGLADTSILYFKADGIFLDAVGVQELTARLVRWLSKRTLKLEGERWLKMT